MAGIRANAKIPSKDKAVFASRLKQIWLQPDIDSARAYAENLMDEHENRYPEAIKVITGHLIEHSKDWSAGKAHPS